MDPVIRDARAEDLDRIKRIAVDAEMFAPDEVGMFDEMFGGFLTGTMERHRWIVLDESGTVSGAAYFAPEPFADRMWNLYFIAVHPEAQGRGFGKILLAAVNRELRSRALDDARTLIVETSSTEQYAATRQFYAAQGFVEEARIRQFYGPNDDKVVFWKSLVEP